MDICSSKGGIFVKACVSPFEALACQSRCVCVSCRSSACSKLWIILNMLESHAWTFKTKVCVDVWPVAMLGCVK